MELERITLMVEGISDEPGALIFASDEAEATQYLNKIEYGGVDVVEINVEETTVEFHPTFKCKEDANGMLVELREEHPCGRFSISQCYNGWLIWVTGYRPILAFED